MTFTKLRDVIEKIKRVHREVMDRCRDAAEASDELLREALQVHRAVSALVGSLRDILKSPGASEILAKLAEFEEEIARRLGRADTTRFDI